MNYRLLRSLLVGALVALPLLGAAQSTEVRTLVREGTKLHDAGRFEEAVAKYQEALKLEPGSGLAQYELAMTYNSMGRNEEAAKLCRALLATPQSATAEVYVTYGNVLDAQKKPKEAIRIYEQGIKRFPEVELLHFNLGIAQYGQQQTEAAVASLQRAVQLQPQHASAHLFLGLLTAETGNRVPAILELARFLMLEPQGRRASTYLPHFDKLMRAGAEKTGDNSITLNVSKQTLDAAQKGKGADNFAQAEMMLSMMAALDYDDKHKDKTPTARMAEKLDRLIGSFAEKDTRKGFVWEYYVPYFLEMKRRDFVPAFTYFIRSAHTDQPDVQQWLDAHSAEVAALREWSKNYEWGK
ncbi:tetratricopeptide repeat protein [Hymenobacter sp. B81]|uniref:tetratricopeptide repeat protein n=1 Tax=Hymenobacter sp. B81 TaxID=3344878 RepID=UPI0037DC88B8